MIIHNLIFFISIISNLLLFGMENYDSGHVDTPLNTIIPIDKDPTLTPLFVAIFIRDTAGVEKALKDGIDINKPHRYYGTTSLMHAIILKQSDVVRLLLENNACINTIDNLERTALMYALKNYDEEIIDALLSKGANVNQKVLPLDYEVIGGNIGKIKKLISNNEFDKTHSFFAPLSWAIYTNNKEIAELLLNHNIIDNEYLPDESPLMQAIYRKRIDFVSLLGARAKREELDNARSVLSNPEKLKNRDMQREILTILDIFSSDDVQEYLKDKEGYYKKNVEANTQGRFLRFRTGQTILMMAAIINDHITLNRLLKLQLPQAYINAKDKTGSTALIYAAKCNNLEAMQQLYDFVNKGVFLKTSFKKNAMDYALYYNNTAMYMRLLEAYLKIYQIHHKFPLHGLERWLNLAQENKNDTIRNLTIISLINHNIINITEK